MLHTKIKTILTISQILQTACAETRKVNQLHGTHQIANVQLEQPVTSTVDQNRPQENIAHNLTFMQVYNKKRHEALFSVRSIWALISANIVHNDTSTQHRIGAYLASEL